MTDWDDRIEPPDDSLVRNRQVLTIGPKSVDEEEGVEAVAKAYFPGGDEDVEPSRAMAPGESGSAQSIFQKEGVIPPPYAPETFVKIFEHSSAIRPNVDAYAVNIDGFGHRFEPVIDLEKEEAVEEVATAMFFERLAEMEDGDEDGDPGQSFEPSKTDVEAKIEEMRHEMKIERAKLEAFFKFASVEESFISLRKRTREDVEVQGNGYWEILRNPNGVPAQFNYLPAFTMRLLPADRETTLVDMKVKRTAFTFEELRLHRRFRRFLQVHENRKVYFKEYGDPRTVSARTGKVYKDDAEMARHDEERGAAPASEVVHFRIPSSRTPYGIPRWVGVMLTAIGSRQAEEVNFLYFDNKSIPPLAVLVSGGRLAKRSVEKLETFIEDRIKGRKNFHRIMVIEAIPVGSGGSLDNTSTGRMTVEIKPLTDAQQKDALFQNYDERNIDKIGMAFRIPRLLRGDIRDFNRATAEAALAYAESQVFSPERNEFDWKINHHFLPEIGIRFWTFASNGPKTRDPVDLAEIIVEFVKSSILTPEEGRELASAIFNRDFMKLDEIWTKIPPALVAEGIKQGVALGEVATGVEIPEPPPAPEPPAKKPEEDEEEEGDEEEDEDEGDEKGDEKKPAAKKLTPKKRQRLARLVRDLATIREELRDEEKKEVRRKFESEHAAANTDEPEVETIQLPADEFATLFDVDTSE